MKVIKTEEEFKEAVDSGVAGEPGILGAYIKGISLNSAFSVERSRVSFFRCVFESCTSNDISNEVGFDLRGRLYFDDCKIRNCNFEVKKIINFEDCYIYNCGLFSVDNIYLNGKVILENSKIVNSFQKIHADGSTIANFVNSEIISEDSLTFKCFHTWKIYVRNCEINIGNVIFGMDNYLVGTDHFNMIMGIKRELYVNGLITLSKIDFSKANTNCKIIGDPMTVEKCDLSDTDLSFMDCRRIIFRNCKTNSRTVIGSSHRGVHEGTIESGNFTLIKEGEYS